MTDWRALVDRICLAQLLGNKLSVQEQTQALLVSEEYAQHVPRNDVAEKLFLMALQHICNDVRESHETDKTDSQLSETPELLAYCSSRNAILKHINQPVSDPRRVTARMCASLHRGDIDNALHRYLYLIIHERELTKDYPEVLKLLAQVSSFFLSGSLPVLSQQNQRTMALIDAVV